MCPTPCICITYWSSPSLPPSLCGYIYFEYLFRSIGERIGPCTSFINSRMSYTPPSPLSLSHTHTHHPHHSFTHLLLFRQWHERQGDKYLRTNDGRERGHPYRGKQVITVQLQQLLPTIAMFGQLEPLPERSRGRSGGGGELGWGGLRAVGVTRGCGA